MNELRTRTREPPNIGMSNSFALDIFEELIAVHTGRRYLTLNTNRSQTRDRLEFLHSQMVEARNLWHTHEYTQAAAILRRSSDPKSLARCWRATRSDDLKQFAQAKESTIKRMDDLADLLEMAAKQIGKAQKSNGRLLEHAEVDKIVRDLASSLCIPASALTATATERALDELVDAHTAWIKADVDVDFDKLAAGEIARQVTNS
jgi:hypothetical protein